MQPWIVVATMLWAALHDRPVSWACQPDHWSTTRLQPWRIPSEATIQGYQLVTATCKAKKPGSGKHYQSPHRFHSIELRQHPFGQDLYKVRTPIERSFGNATSFGGGLAPLPAWVRTLDRVRTWV